MTTFHDILGAAAYGLIVALFLYSVAWLSRPPKRRPKSEAELAIERYRREEYLIECERSRVTAYEELEKGYASAMYREPSGGYVTLVGPLMRFSEEVFR